MGWWNSEGGRGEVTVLDEVRIIAGVFGERRNEMA